MLLGDASEHPAQFDQVHSTFAGSTREQARQSISFGSDPLGLTQRLPHQPTAPEREASTHSWVSLDRSPHLCDDELGVSGVGEHLEHQRARLLVEQN